MRSLRGAVAALLMTGLPVVGAQPALAQAQPAAKAERMFQEMTAACAAPLGEAGKPIRLGQTLDDGQRAALLGAIFLALHDPTGADAWPEREVAAAPPCPVARFEAGDLIWTISGGGADLPVRWVRAPNREDFFFLAKGPALSDAGVWAQGGRRGLPAANAPPAYYLVNRASGMNYVVQAFDGPPSARRIAEAVGRVFEDGADYLIAVHDPVGDAITLFVETESRVQAEIFRPQDIAPGGELFAGLYLPDEHFFTWGEDDAIVMRGSGFSCARSYGPFEREMVGVHNPAEASLDLSCQLEGEPGRMAVFVTHGPDASRDKAAWANKIRSLEEQTGVARKLESPPKGPRKQIQAGRTWLDNGGSLQLVLFLRRGDYVYEIRQTHAPQALQGANEALLAVLNQIDLPDARTADGWKARR